VQLLGELVLLLAGALPRLERVQDILADAHRVVLGVVQPDPCPKGRSGMRIVHETHSKSDRKQREMTESSRNNANKHAQNPPRNDEQLSQKASVWSR
jgi:hypothetical protein